MPCFKPIPMEKIITVGKYTGIAHTSYKPTVEGPHVDMRVPCNRCIGCRMRYSTDWGLRIVHEARMHETSSFITLTYDKMPKDGSLHYQDFQDFMKRLRRRLGSKIRFFMCGEYGSKRNRPHFHAAIFGADFKKDSYFVPGGKTKPLWANLILREAWGHGHVSVGELNFESAKYIARYVTKKQYGRNQENYARQDFDPETGEVSREYSVRPEFAKMSLKPGLGASFYEKYRSDIHPRNVCVHDSRELPVPRYYQRLLQRFDPAMFKLVKSAVEEKALENPHDQAKLDLQREYYEELAKHYERNFDNET